MNASARWTQNPIVVVPLGAVALGLVFVPFAIGTVDHVAEFYGAFLAAIVSTAAAMSGYTLFALIQFAVGG